MLTILSSMSILMSITLIFLNHPMSLGMILLAQSLIIALSTGFFFLNFWFSYILFIIMVGGLLVLFIYMTSIASNELFKFSNFLMIFIASTLIIIMLIMIFNDKFNNSSLMIIQDTLMSFNNSMPMTNFNKYLNYPSNIILLFLIIYLFITLIAVVKITNITQGPLRQN